MVRFQHNPFTDKLDISAMGPGSTTVDFVTGNDGILVPADAGYNINILGNNAQGITTTGDAGTSTLTITAFDATTSQKGVQANSSNVQAAAQSSTDTTLTPSNITSFFSTSPLPTSQGGTGRSSPAANSLLVTNGSSPFILLGVASNGQIPIGSAFSPPVLANITSSNSTITITNGPGTINLATGATLATSYSTNSGSAVPSAGVLQVLGTNGISTSGAGNTVTVNGAGLVITLGAFGSTPNANGLSLAANVLNMQPADGTNPGGVSTTTQNFAGNKIFNTSATSGSFLVLSGGGGSVNVQYPSSATSFNFNMPTSAGTAGYFLTSQGGGSTNMTWTNPASFTSSWIDQGSSTTIASNTNYFATGAATLTLPASPSQGDTIQIVVDTTGSVVIAANTGQVIRLGTSISASAGNITNTQRGDAVQLVYRSTGAVWMNKNCPVGGWTVT